VASKIVVRSEMLQLLRLRDKNEHIGAVVITCGLRLVWEKVLAKAGLSKPVKVIGGGRISDGYVVSGKVKAGLVTHLKEEHDMYVVAIGDSQVDLAMMDEAHKAIVVVGEEHTRGKTMDEALTDALINDGFRAKQVLLPKTASPRLDIVRLPLVEFTEHDFLHSVASHHASITVIHATTKNATKVLMTPTRNKNIAGPTLREYHRQIGWYLATEYLTDPSVIGIETYPVTHVQGHNVDGHQLKDERKTTIVALMRGGEPMAFGVNDAFPLAMFVHAKDREDLKEHHLKGRSTVILVDSVVNNGKTVIDFVRHARSLSKDIRIVVVAGVVQKKATNILKDQLTKDQSFSLVALRLSANKYTGTGAVDTGNRLFNSTALPGLRPESEGGRI
jgi:uracil phosphoribosyltransferase